MEKRVFLKETQDIHLVGRITTKCMRQIIGAMRKAQGTDTSIVLYINSEGGDVLPALELYHFLRNAGDVVGVVDHAAHSMAAVVLQGCRVRKAYSNAHITIHDMNVTVQGTVWDMEKGIVAALEQRKKIQQKIYAIFAERSAKSIKEIAEKCHKGITFSASGAKEAGLIDEVII